MKKKLDFSFRSQTRPIVWMMQMAHGMLWNLPGETADVWTVIAAAAALRKYTE